MERRLSVKEFNHENIQGLLNCIRDGVFITDGDGNIILMNEASEELSEFSGEQLLGKNVNDLIKKGYFSENGAVSLKCIETGREESMIQKGRDDGQEITVTGVPLIEHGKVKFVVVTERDVSEINRLEKELRKNQQLVKEYSQQLEQYRKDARGARGSIIYDSEEMEKIIQLSESVAKKDITVLIQGESGTGKEVIANHIHQCSDRKDKPFIRVNCDAIPENLFESEFFGYEKGTFTGASDTGKVGLFEQANGGTIFLDEIGIMPMSLQGKILRVLQNREIMRVGGGGYIPVDVRIIAATNANLKDAVREKTFRMDLYYRLNVVPINIPPLRKRKEDIFPLVRYFVKKYNEEFDSDLKIAKSGWDVLYKYQWPGNIRELQNIIKRLVIIADREEVDARQIMEQLDSFDMGIAESTSSGDLKSYVEEYEKNIIITKMKDYKSSSRLARALGIDKSTLNRKIKKYGIEAGYDD